ncbi:tRNA (adenosine(37)-N6)-threonylcarbamoyltransferase complex transferase subunit TsaD [Opitutales bacterium ASA1]|uniref:tRNA (adenosine(37)-N6)-threonylcarbamoyltransferase complex transferase subunit TsaD n=1 Tax=Congregicoccus parvus TaxID=3081749 RepID=UPI002B2CE6D5|nr:tRNA (adenosine(37)-N6)-threonylcarbamoyltransferase complex transferase subunit TsaD [Opitutales bacterium ASA1]
MNAAAGSTAWLAIESSCDESAVALFDPANGLAGEWVSSQIALHAEYGGVVPELAVREHLVGLPLLLAQARGHSLWPHIARVAVTAGPGLAGCLTLGVSAARAAGLALGCPIVPVNHLRGHAWSVFIPVHAADPGTYDERLRPLLPHAGLLVSGGNTVLFVVHEDLRIECLGSTIDDAAGEALDKGAKLLGLGYPGGPLVERLAREGDPRAFDFPRALPGRGDLDFSFSGLKTSLRYRAAGLGESEARRRRPDLCASYQAAVLDVLERKTGFAVEMTGARSLGLSGGVANNLALRTRLEGLAARHGIPFLPALPRHTGDNAGMIAFAAWTEHRQTLAAGAEPESVQIHPSLPLDRRP